MKNFSLFAYFLCFLAVLVNGNSGPLTANLYNFFALKLLDISAIYGILLAVRDKNADVSVLIYLMDFSCS